MTKKVSLPHIDKENVKQRRRDDKECVCLHIDKENVKQRRRDDKEGVFATYR